MLKIFRLIFRSGVATTGYPAVPEPAPPRFRGRPALIPAACDASGDCVSVCPSDALSLGDVNTTGMQRWRLDLGRCVFCGLCAQACPNDAITLTTDFELAARKRADLIVQIVPAARAGVRSGKEGSP